MYQPTEEIAKQHTDGIGKKVEPLAGAGGGAVGLAQFHQSTEDNHAHEGKQEQGSQVWLAGFFFAVTQVFPPDDAGGASVHDEVGPLVDELHFVEGCLREKGGERQDEYQCQTET